MEVLAVTIFFSVLLAVCFVVLFIGSQRGRRLSYEQEALMPLDDDFQPGRRIEQPAATEEAPPLN